MEKVLITGATGYLGACIFNLFENDSNYIVEKLNIRLHEIQPKSLDYDLVIHCAGALRHKQEELKSTNSEGTNYVLNGLVKKTNFIYISSKSVFGTKRKGTVNEDSIPQPDEDYGITKYEGELAIKKSDNPFIIFRPSTLYGLGINNFGPGFPSLALKKLFHGENISLHSRDVNQEYLYVKDAAKAVYLLNNNPNSWNETYILSGKKSSLHNLIKGIENDFSQRKENCGKVIITNKPSYESFFMNCSKIETLLNGKLHTSDAKIREEAFNYLSEK